MLDLDSAESMDLQNSNARGTIYLRCDEGNPAEVFDEIAISRKDFKAICSEIDKEALKGVDYIINKYQMAKVKSDEESGVFLIDVPEIHIPAFKMAVDVSEESEWEEEFEEIDTKLTEVVESVEIYENTLPKGYLKNMVTIISKGIFNQLEKACEKYQKTLND